MPIFQLSTNVSKDNIPKDFLKTTSKLVASTLGKPESYVVVHVNPDQLLLWKGTNEPAGFATLKSIGRLGIQENKKHAAVLSSHINKFLGIPPDRFYIHFVDVPAAEIGYNNTTFHEIFAER